MKKIIQTIKNIGGFMAVLSIVASSFAFNVSPAYACSCMMPKPPTEALADSASVFHGKVTKIVDSSYRNGYMVSFSVEKSWKGDAVKTVDVSTARDSAACGINFEIGKTYVVYTYAEEDGSLTTGLCSRTHEVSDVATDEDIIALNSVVTDTADTNATSTTGTSTSGTGSYPYRPLVLTIGTVIVLGAAFFLARKKTVSAQ